MIKIFILKFFFLIFWIRLRKYRKIPSKQALLAKISRRDVESTAEVLDEREEEQRKKYEEEDTYMNVKQRESAEYFNLAVGKPEELEIYLNQLIYSPHLKSEFQSVPKKVEKTCLHGSHPLNKMKNRYRNNLPYDETRVVLSIMNNDPNSDYINASFVDGTDPKKRYIAAQGPKSGQCSTIHDFWRMVIEQKVDIIVMVANFIEREKVKVDAYFDPDEPYEIGNYSVRVIDRLQEPHFIRSKIHAYDSSSEVLLREVIHYHFTSWPDHGVPSQILPFLSMVKQISKDFKKGIIAVHCSAGLGRTGTLLLILLLKEAYDQLNIIEPIQILKSMRECRAGLVDSFDQFKLALLTFYEDLFGEIGSMNMSDFEKNWTLYFQEADVLYMRLIKQPFNHEYNYGKNHISMNRNPSLLPCDPYLVLFDNVELKDNPDYLNAIMIDVDDILSSIIVTEHPMNSTIHNFWKMIFLKNCSHLFLLNCPKNSQDYPPIFPHQEVSKYYNELQLQTRKVDSPHPLGEQYSVKISYQNDCHTLNALHVLSWGTDLEVPKNINDLEEITSFILETAKSQEPFVICCNDGVTSCGLLACSVYVINRLKVYQEFNVYNSVLKIRKYRPEFIVSKRQFQALYQVALNYLQKNSIYQNFM